jgi:hypothetical protein
MERVKGYQPLLRVETTSNTVDLFYLSFQWTVDQFNLLPLSRSNYLGILPAALEQIPDQYKQLEQY